MSNQLAKISDLKAFGISPQQINSAISGRPLLEVPLHRIILNAIGSTFQTDELDTLGQLCGEILRRIGTDPKGRHEVFDMARKFSAMIEGGECYRNFNVSLVVLLPISCGDMSAEDASKLLTTFFLRLESELLASQEQD